MNYTKQIAQVLGLELEEEFYVEGCDGYTFKITEKGFHWKRNDGWDRVLFNFDDVLTGRSKIIKKSILDKTEKEYLNNIIKPFRNQVFNICKHSIICGGYEYEQIKIKVKDGFDNHFTTISLPLFKKGIMYKGMKSGKEYNVEDLEV